MWFIYPTKEEKCQKIEQLVEAITQDHPEETFFVDEANLWNKIEHKMFSYIIFNWRGVPLISREAVAQLIGNTTTTTGLKIESQIDYRRYEKGEEVGDQDYESIGIIRDKFHGKLNLW